VLGYTFDNPKIAEIDTQLRNRSKTSIGRLSLKTVIKTTVHSRIRASIGKGRITQKTNPEEETLIQSFNLNNLRFA